MYAVIKTGGKQYRVQPGDLLVVEKLDGEPGAEVRFDQVLMLGDDAGATVGAPLVAGAAVTATLIETRKGEKVKIFKKIRRQGYRRTRGHRQPESVLRVTGLAGEGKEAKWDGTVDLTPKAVLDARARGLTNLVAQLTASTVAQAAPAGVTATDVVAEGSKSSPKVKAQVVEHADPVVTEEAPAPAKKAAPKKAKAEAAPAAEADAAPAPKAKKSPAKKAAPEGGEA
jgi:large subunit ribosomal protein L21